MVDKHKTLKTVGAILGCGILLVGGVFAGANLFPKEVSVPGPTVTETVTQEVPVDNGNLGLVLDSLYEHDGNINYITSDLDDDEVSQITDRIVFENEVKGLAVDAVKTKLFHELNGKKFNEEDMEKLRINDEDDEVFVTGIDWDNEDATVEVTGTFEQYNDKFEYTALLNFKDGVFDDFESIETDKL